MKAVGFSGHHNDIAIDMAAVALGAEWIERHFTLDRT
jgi:sialic acid synthase